MNSFLLIRNSLSRQDFSQYKLNTLILLLLIDNIHQLMETNLWHGQLCSYVIMFDEITALYSPGCMTFLSKQSFAVLTKAKSLLVITCYWRLTANQSCHSTIRIRATVLSGQQPDLLQKWDWSFSQNGSADTIQWILLFGWSQSVLVLQLTEEEFSFLMWLHLV